MRIAASGVGLLCSPAVGAEFGQDNARCRVRASSQRKSSTTEQALGRGQAIGQGGQEATEDELVPREHAKLRVAYF